MVHVETDSNPCLRRLSAAYEWAWNKNVTRAQESIGVTVLRVVWQAFRGEGSTIGTDLTLASRLAGREGYRMEGVWGLIPWGPSLARDCEGVCRPVLYRVRPKRVPLNEELHLQRLIGVLT